MAALSKEKGLWKDEMHILLESHTTDHQITYNEKLFMVGTLCAVETLDL